MIPENGSYAVTWAGNEIPFQLHRTKRRTLSITVRPDLTVKVTAPVTAPIDSVIRKVGRRARWIMKQQRVFREYLPPTPPRCFVAGESHRYRGRQYRLKTHQSAVRAVKLSGQFLHVTTRDKRNSARVKELVIGWYRARARAVFERSLAAALKKFPTLQKSPPDVRLRAMRKRWGSCKRGVIYLNPELVQAPPSCIDFVITHELCHLLQPNHGRAFYNLLQTIMPDWKSRKARLEKALI